MPRLPVALVAALLASCGGGGGDSDPAPAAIPPAADDPNPFEPITEPVTPPIENVLPAVAPDTPPVIVDNEPDPPPIAEPAPTTPEPTSMSDPLTEPEPEPVTLPPIDPVAGLDLVEGVEVPLTSEPGPVFGRVIGFSVTDRGRPEITLRVDNNSSEEIYSLNCDVSGLLGNRVIGSARLFFAGLGPIAPGEAAVDTGGWFGEDNGFAAFDQLRWSCEWINGERFSTVDVSSGPIAVDFVEYTTEFGQPAVTLLVTNNSTFTIYNVGCTVAARRDDVIVGGERLFFADLDDIRPGEAAEETERFSDIDSFDDFDSDSFDPANLSCSYLVRR